MINNNQIISVGVFALVMVALLGFSCPSRAEGNGKLGGFLGGGLTGAAIGGIAGGGKGAAIGGPVGAVAGLAIGASVDNSRKRRRERQPVVYEEEIYEYDEDEMEPQIEPEVQYRPTKRRRIVRTPMRRACSRCGCPSCGA